MAPGRHVFEERNQRVASVCKKHGLFRAASNEDDIDFGTDARQSHYSSFKGKYNYTVLKRLFFNYGDIFFVISVFLLGKKY